ncbi:RAI1 like PD-XK nuclease-domain-containing protein [Paecilomyces variotii]|uniref:Decapping nuclease n=1 Tax=Byssochlamys spectabilis TaxID=264951 RepID=A0A443HLY0_BYSSP|nr:RAI1 like PD-XK nuclease-domain-containing protein [Paecilomyces variotii]RWQ92819.1 RAI1 like PD-XK nuclease-domain-containing protein [Paecilomyces variotii]
MNSQAFDIFPLERFQGSDATIRRPREIACFSYDDEHRFHLDDSSLRYYYPPDLPADLSRGFDTFQQLDDSGDEHLDALLETIMAHEKSTGSKCEADVITWRGMMTKIMTAPFDIMNGFEMNVTNFQGTIFIEENNAYKNEQKRAQRNQRMPPGMPSQDMMSFWGYKFETLSVLSKPWDPTPREEIEGRADQIVNNKAQYCSVVRTGIGKAKMIIGGEVDAVWDCKPERKEDPINWVELKTSAEIRNDRDMLKYERKLLKFWAQSFLLGVPKIIVGFRNQDGILQRLEELETHAIPGKVKRVGKGTWDGNICINFTAGFLEWLKMKVQGQGLWRIRKREKSPVIELFKVEEGGHGDIISPAFMAWQRGTVQRHAPRDMRIEEDRLAYLLLNGLEAYYRKTIRRFRRMGNICVDMFLQRTWPDLFGPS